MISSTGSAEAIAFSEEEVSAVVTDFLSGGNQIAGFAGDFSIFLGDDTITGSDEFMAEYFSLLRTYRDATSPQDCDSIAYGADPEKTSLLLQNACKLAFIQDLDSECTSIVEAEIDSCALSSDSENLEEDKNNKSLYYI